MATVNLGSIKFNWKGAYSGATAYVVDDVVESSGSSYICIAATTGNAPPNASYWEQMSSAGTDGTDLTTTLTTQGDIVYRDASGLARLGAGTSGQALITNGTGANPSWGTVAGGKILQVVSATDGTTRSTTSTSFVTASNTCTLNITPSATSSKILLMFGSIAQIDTQSGHMAYYTIFKNGSNLVGNEGMSGIGNYAASSTSGYMFGSADIKYIDSPNTTSQLTYAIYMRSENSSYNARIGAGGSGNTDSILIAMEIGV